jgi:hypothetical protein
MFEEVCLYRPLADAKQGQEAGGEDRKLTGGGDSKGVGGAGGGADSKDAKGGFHK